MKRLTSSSSLGCLVIATAVLGAAWPASSHATLITSSYVPGGPTFQAVGGTLTYDSGTKVFDASLLPVVYTPAGSPGNLVFFDPTTPDGNLSLTVDLRVDNNGKFLSNGSGVTLVGALDFDSDGTDDANGTLLTGNILAFGAGNPGQTPGSLPYPFNGLFKVTGGLLSQPVPLTGGGTLAAEFPVGTLGGFNLSAETQVSGIVGNFAQSFSASNVKSDTGIVAPEPSGILMALIGSATLAGCALVRRCRPR
jgi:hypothetical protein